MVNNEEKNENKIKKTSEKLKSKIEKMLKDDVDKKEFWDYAYRYFSITSKFANYSFKHSNRYFVLYKNKDNNECEYKEVLASRVKNDYNLDLFSYKDGVKSKISEGKTGVSLYEGTGANFKKYLEEQGGIDEIYSRIDKTIEVYGLTPRYTEPENNRIRVDCLQGKKRKFFICFREVLNSEEAGLIKLYKEQKDELDELWNGNPNKETQYTVYIMYADMMIPLASNIDLEDVLEEHRDSLIEYALSANKNAFDEYVLSETKEL